MHRLFIALILLSLTCGSYAAEVNNLYQSQIAVSSRDDGEREKLTPELLKNVILKVVGDSRLLSSTDLAPIVIDANDYVQKFEYLRTNNIEADLTQPDQLSLRLSFDPETVNAAVSQLGLPIWGKLRPEVLTWVVLEQNGQQQLLGLDQSVPSLSTSLEAAAANRGLPLLMPLMDLQDQTKLTVDSLRSADLNIVRNASQRYGADVILLARVSLNQNAAQIRWLADISGEEQRWESQGTLTEAMTAGIGQLTDSLASHYTQRVDLATQSQRVALHISDVLDYGDFSRLMSYLNQLDYITDIQVTNLSDQKLDLDVAFNGSLQLLERTLSVGRMLVEENQIDNPEKKFYRLLP